MDGCLACLAQEYLTVKFCRIRASEARLSFRFVSAQPVSCKVLLYGVFTLGEIQCRNYNGHISVSPESEHLVVCSSSFKIVT